MRLLTAVVQAGMVGAVVYAAVRVIQAEMDDRQFWQSVRVWIESHSTERGERCD